MNASETMG